MKAMYLKDWETDKLAAQYWVPDYDGNAGVEDDEARVGMREDAAQQ